MSRIVQMVGLQKPSIESINSEFTTDTTKDRLRLEIVNALKLIGRSSLVAPPAYGDNGWELDETWYDRNWTNLLRSGDSTYQTQSTYIILKKRVSFGTVGTYGTKQLDLQQRLVPYGKRGSGRSLFDMCQMVSSELESYTVGNRTNYRQYWIIGMESTNKPEIAFHAKSGPMLIVIRGIHNEVEHKTALAVEILAVGDWIRSYGLTDSDFSIIVDQDWHAAKCYQSTGNIVPIRRGDPDYYVKSSSKAAYIKDRGYSVERRAEFVLKVVYTGGTMGMNNHTDPKYQRIKNVFEAEFNATGPYINVGGFRLERFLSFEQMHNNRVHTAEADVPHITVLENITDHVLAKDVAEELLVQNWHILPNAVTIFYEPKVSLPWVTRGARLVLVWRHVLEPTAGCDPQTQAEFIARTRTDLELSGTSVKYSSLKLGGLSCKSLIDTRSRFVDLGIRYKRAGVLTGTATPSASPARKKKKGVKTPDHAMTIHTPQSGSSASSITVRSVNSEAVERYTDHSEQLSSVLSQLTLLATDLTQLRAQCENDNNMRTAERVSDKLDQKREREMERAADKQEQRELREAERQELQAQFQVLDAKYTKVVAMVQSGELKATLKKIREAASKHESLLRKLGLLRKQLTTAEPGDRSQGIADQIELSELEQVELCLSLVEFRSEARELANVDGVQLNAEQLREDVK